MLWYIESMRALPSTVRAPACYHDVKRWLSDSAASSPGTGSSALGGSGGGRRCGGEAMAQHGVLVAARRCSPTLSSIALAYVSVATSHPTALDNDPRPEPCLRSLAATIDADQLAGALRGCRAAAPGPAAARGCTGGGSSCRPVSWSLHHAPRSSSSPKGGRVVVHWCAGGQADAGRRPKRRRRRRSTNVGCKRSALGHPLHAMQCAWRSGWRAPPHGTERYGSCWVPLTPLCGETAPLTAAPWHAMPLLLSLWSRPPASVGVIFIPECEVVLDAWQFCRTPSLSRTTPASALSTCCRSTGALHLAYDIGDLACLPGSAGLQGLPRVCCWGAAAMQRGRGGRGVSCKGRPCYAMPCLLLAVPDKLGLHALVPSCLLCSGQVV